MTSTISKKKRGQSAYLLFAHQVAPLLWNRKPFNKHRRWLNFIGYVKNHVVEKYSQQDWEKYLENAMLKEISQTENQLISSGQQEIAKILFKERFNPIYNSISKTNPDELIAKFNEEVLSKKRKPRRRYKTKTIVITDDITEQINDKCPEINEIDLQDTETENEKTPSKIEIKINQIDSKIEKHKRKINELQKKREKLELKIRKKLKGDTYQNVHLKINKE